MKWGCFFCLLPCLLMQDLVSGAEPISVTKSLGVFQFTCMKWSSLEENEKLLNLSYKDGDSGDYICEHDGKSITLTVRFRTCENCIQLDAPALSAVIVGNIVATFFVAFAVYSIAGESKGKSFSGNKASDKVNLLTNGETDTYQQLNPGQSAEYSRLKGGRRN
ncbi:hypothetical protein KOW79_014910 [Hemibagrus wyckioides]|uniref:Uncharacterized protein n=1 Tax=Hemibagrus wyckioides TaxID=337641 RepID=A0A9D3NJL4_9TELE|nr:T-cell surface glycoprotein CD3 delta chain-like [Hemibagrus wyckioides]XP_058268925.1 T-cell surface glycoprotein CD3 delta chain-like [Hemibagrus wyckioides]KAG7322052.1 hypothetical protein KOW79_014910 [Hemibagrus wyckioides]